MDVQSNAEEKGKADDDESADDVATDQTEKQNMCVILFRIAFDRQN